MQTIVELPEFIKQSDKVLSESEKQSITIPLFLLTLFAKGKKSNIDKAERNELSKLTSLLIKIYGGHHE